MASEQDEWFRWLFRWSGIGIGVVMIVAGAALHHGAPKDGTWGQLSGIVATEVGAVLLALAVLHMLYDRGREAATLAAIKRAAVETNDQVKTFHAVGVKEIRTNLEPDAFATLVKNCHSLTVMKTWFPDHSTIAATILELLRKPPKHGTRAIKLLLCHPNSAVLTTRSVGATASASRGRDDIVGSLQQISDTLGRRVDQRVTIEIRFHHEWPAAPVIWVDNAAFVGFYFNERSSPFWPWLQVEPGSQFAAILEEQREYLMARVVQDREGAIVLRQLPSGANTLHVWATVETSDATGPESPWPGSNGPTHNSPRLPRMSRLRAGACVAKRNSCTARSICCLTTAV